MLNILNGDDNVDGYEKRGRYIGIGQEDGVYLREIDV